MAIRTMLVAVALLGGAAVMMTVDSAAACGSFSEAPPLLLVQQPQGTHEQSDQWLADAAAAGDRGVAAAAFARRLLRRRGYHRGVGTIDGKPATSTRQLALVRDILETAVALAPNNASLATDLGEVLTLSPHEADRIRGLNVLLRLDRQGTLTTAEGYRALSRMWRAAGVQERAQAAHEECLVLAAGHAQCIDVSLTSPLRLASAVDSPPMS